MIQYSETGTVAESGDKVCGRFSLFDLLSVAVRYNINLPGWVKPRYNIAPSQHILAIVKDKGSFRPVRFQWGLIPFWAKEVAPASLLINARAETVDKKPAFKQSFRRKRCLIPADGFYEWRKEGSQKKPYRIKLKNDGLFAFAGLWEKWVTPQGKVIYSCAIITTAANELVKPVHDRMPAILAGEEQEAWLEAAAVVSDLKKLLKPYPAELMSSYEISATVNSTKNDGPEILKPVDIS